VHVRELLKTPHWIVVATAHPAKFETVVEPLVGRTLEIPPALRELLERPSRFTEIDATLEALTRARETAS